MDFLLLFALTGIAVIMMRWLLAWGLTPLSRQALRQMFVERLLASHDHITLLPGEDDEVNVQVDDLPCSIHLDALHRRCAEYPYRALLYVRQAVQAFAASLAQADGWPADWEERVVPLLLRTDTMPAPNLVTRPVVETLAVGYVLNGEEMFRWITRDDVAEAGIDEERLHALAIRNLERSCNALNIDAPPPLPDGHDRLVSFRTGDGLDATRVLLPSFYRRFAPRFGDVNLLVAIPTRDMLIMIGEPDHGQASLLAWRADSERTRRAYPLMDRLLRVTDFGIEIWSPNGSAVEASV